MDLVGPMVVEGFMLGILVKVVVTVVDTVMKMMIHITTVVEMITGKEVVVGIQFTIPMACIMRNMAVAMGIMEFETNKQLFFTVKDKEKRMVMHRPSMM